MIAGDGAGRRVWADLELLDRQLRDRAGTLCGKVDDVELACDEHGRMYASAILTGPGRLLERLGRRRLGGWLVRFMSENAPDGRDASRVPFEYVHSIGAVIDLSLDADEVGTSRTERWTRDHVIAHIVGNRHDPE
jgi:sporulation protein YlmC with PRC-barrel domain